MKPKVDTEKINKIDKFLATQPRKRERRLKLFKSGMKVKTLLPTLQK